MAAKEKVPAKSWWALFAICLITVMISIDATAVNIGIPVIAHEFKAALSNTQWIINAFFLAAAMVQILGGHLGDNYGHRKIFLLNVLIFTLSSAGAGFAPNEQILIFFRALQGASVGIATPLTFVLIYEAFPEKMQSFARSIVVACMGISLAIGPPLGGLFVHTIGWRWIFFINIPLGLACYSITVMTCKRSPVEHKKPLHFTSNLYLFLILFFFAFGINELQNWGFDSWQFWALMIGALLFLILLYVRDKREKDPIVDFNLFKQRRFVLNSVIRIVNQIVFLGYLFFLPLYLQNVANLSALVSGLTMLGLTLGMFIVSPLMGKWIDRKGEERANIFSMILLCISSFMLVFINIPINFYLLVSLLIIGGVGIATLYVSTTTGALRGLEKKKIGSVTGVYLTIAWLACALGVALSGTVIAFAAKSTSQDPLLQRAAQGLVPLSTLGDPVMQEQAQKAFVMGVHDNAWLFLFCSIIGLILSLFQQKKHLN